MNQFWPIGSCASSYLSATRLELRDRSGMPIQTICCQDKVNQDAARSGNQKIYLYSSQVSWVNRFRIEAQFSHSKEKEAIHPESRTKYKVLEKMSPGSTAELHDKNLLFTPGSLLSAINQAELNAWGCMQPRPETPIPIFDEAMNPTTKQERV